MHEYEHVLESGAPLPLLPAQPVSTSTLCRMALARRGSRVSTPSKGCFCQLTELVAEGWEQGRVRPQQQEENEGELDSVCPPAGWDNPGAERRPRLGAAGVLAKWDRLLEVTLRTFHNLERRPDCVYESQWPSVAMCNSVGNTLHGFLALTSPWSVIRPNKKGLYEFSVMAYHSELL